MKYVVVQVVRKVRNPDGTAGEETLELPVIFPKELVHKDMADMVNLAARREIDHWQSTKTVSAGFVNFDADIICHGRSESLGMDSRRDVDAKLIEELGPRY